MPSFYNNTNNTQEPNIFDFIEAVATPYYYNGYAGGCGPGQKRRHHGRHGKETSGGGGGDEQQQQQQLQVPALDLYDREQELILVLAVPQGTQKQDISIDYDPATSEVVVSGESKRPEGFDTEDAQKTRRIAELAYGKFERRTNIAGDAAAQVKFRTDDITAKFEDGFLYVTVPKAEVEAKKRINVL